MNECTNRKGAVVSAAARETEGIVFYQFQFDNPLDPVLPRTGAKDKRPTRAVELYELCVGKGKLWSVQATVRDVYYLQIFIYSFIYVSIVLILRTCFS